MRLATASSAPIARLVFPGQESVVTAGAPGRVTGWGGLLADEENQEYPRDLQVGSVNLISDADCSDRPATYRSAERRVGKGGVSTYRSRWPLSIYKKTTTQVLSATNNNTQSE